MHSYRTLALLTAALLAASAADAAPRTQKKLSKVEPGAAWLMNDYMNCKGVKQTAMDKEMKDMSCDERTNLHYCSIFEPLPKDIQSNISLELYCNFLAGEQAGDEKEDAAIMAAAVKAGCLKGDEVRSALNEKYKGKAEELDSLENFTIAYLDAEDRCFSPDPDAPKPAASAEPAKESAKEPAKKAKTETPQEASPSAGKEEVKKEVQENAKEEITEETVAEESVKPADSRKAKH